MSLRGRSINKLGMIADGAGNVEFEGVVTAQGFNEILGPGKTYYVSRNTGNTTNNGLSWQNPFSTIALGIAALNAAYTAQRQINTLVIEEGWYAELPVTLTASDCLIMSIAPGNHDSTVLYGVPVAGVFSGVAGGYTLSITGSNNTIYGLGFFCSDPLYTAIRIGANASDPDSPTASAPTGNAIINCSIVRDVADGELGGILDYGADGTLIKKCFFSTSCKDYGVKVATNGVVNPVNARIIGCEFVGTPTGIVLTATPHNTLIRGNIFRDDSSDRADTITLPVNNGGNATSTVCIENYWAFSDAAAVTGNQAMMINNFQLATT